MTSRLPNTSGHWNGIISVTIILRCCGVTITCDCGVTITGDCVVSRDGVIVRVVLGAACCVLSSDCELVRAVLGVEMCYLSQINRYKSTI